MAAMRSLLRYVAVAALASGAAAGAASWAAWSALTTQLPVPKDGVVFEIPHGTPLGSAMAELYRRGVLRHPALLTWYARLRGDARRIHAGEYRVSPGATAASLLQSLVDGNVYLHELTIIEGWRFRDLLKAMHENPSIKHGDLSGSQLMAALGEPGTSPEGQFLPDTYSFEKGTNELELLRLAHAALKKKLAEAWARRSPNVQLMTPYQALILASIIEKETALPSERGMISGVLQRRLERGMRLQVDPTVIYGLGDDYDGNLHKEDLSRDTPYNTYTRRGLPPTPIALPSAASIDAAVAPVPGDALYYVATGRSDGSHYFSATLKEHDKAVRAYLKRLRSETD